jgi:L-ribulokinase
LIVSPQETRLPGITGVVKDGILPGLYGYEAGQAAVGDMLAWFVDRVATDAGGYEALEQAAAEIGPGETGLLALDWWNGNRSILGDADLSGAILGLTLQTTREQIYRALLESIAFGSRRIMDNFEEHGLECSTIVACGGIAERSPLMMQLLADTSGREVHVPEVKEMSARGAALFGAVAAGVFDDIAGAISATRPTSLRTYTPDPAAKQTYDGVYEIYRRLYELLGQSEVDLLHGLKRIRTERDTP